MKARWEITRQEPSDFVWAVARTAGDEFTPRYDPEINPEINPEITPGNC